MNYPALYLLISFYFLFLIPPNHLAAQVCIEHINASLPNSCSRTITLNELGKGNFPVGAFIKINDSNPANGEILDGLSPDDGWKYGIFSLSGQLICEGKINTKDYFPPSWSVADSLTWLTQDTLVMWRHDLSQIENNINFWQNIYDPYFTGIPIMLEDSCGGLISISVTDYLQWQTCLEFESTLFRAFSFSDSRGNIKQIQQVIYFRKPIFNNDCSYVPPPNTFNDFGPTNLNSFGVIGTNFGTGICGSPDTVIYNSCGNYSEEEIILLAKDYYTANYLLPSGNASQVSLFDLSEDFSWAFSVKSFQGCSGSSLSEVVVHILDRCSSGIIKDTLYLVYKDLTPPVVSPLDGSLPILGHRKPSTDAEYLALPSLPFDSIRHGCFGEFYLPTSYDFGLLGTLFNWSILDDCSSQGDILWQFKIQTAWEFNNPFYKTYPDFTDIQYPVSPMTNGGEMIQDIPIGYHRIIVSASDGCRNSLQDTLYFLVQDTKEPVMKTKNSLHISLPVTKWKYSERGKFNYENGESRIFVEDINEGSYDLCTLDSLYLRRVISKDFIQLFLLNNMDYDLFSESGHSNGTVDFADFEQINDSTFLTPRGMTYISFFCGDVGKTVYAELWGGDVNPLLDLSASTIINLKPNWNYIQTKIVVEDFSEPIIQAPSTLFPPRKNYIDGTDKEKILSIENPHLSDSLFGIPEIISASCNPIVLYHVEKYLSCDTGFINRVWTLVQVRKPGDTLKHIAKQKITVRAIHSFSFSVPEDVTSQCLAKPQADTDFRWLESGCDLIAVSLSDQAYSSDIKFQNCYKIFRTATFINWCMLPNQWKCERADPTEFARILPRNEGKSQTFHFEKIPSGNDLYSGATRNVEGKPLAAFIPKNTISCAGEQTFAWQYTQIISVIDTLSPSLILGSPKNFKLRELDCQARIKFSFTCKDDCSNATFKGKKIQISKKTGGVVKDYDSFPGYFMSDTCHVDLGDFPEGSYTASITIVDACGNSVFDTISFSIRDSSVTSSICVLQLASSMSLNSSGIPQASIHYSDFLQDPSDNISDCSGAVQYFLERDSLPLSYKPTYNGLGNKLVMLGCTDLNQPLVALRLYRVDKWGNANFCKVFVKLQDPLNLCNIETSSISGKLILAPGFNLSGFQIRVVGTGKLGVTNQEGIFKINNLPKADKYFVTITKESQFLEGISTYDLLLINRHILGVRPFLNKWNFFAADVNNSGSVTTLDMVILKKLILLMEKSFPNSPNWHFFDNDFRQRVEFSPFLPNTYKEILGVKTGDVSGSNG